MTKSTNLRKSVVLFDLLIVFLIGLLLVVSAKGRTQYSLEIREDAANNKCVNAPIKAPISLPKGTYELELLYETDRQQEVFFTPYQTYLVSDFLYYLDPHDGVARLNFEVSKPIDDYEIFTNYNGEGTFSIKGATVYKTMDGALRVVPITLLFLLLLTGGIFLWTSNNPQQIVVLLGITGLISLPLFSSGVSVGDDIEFHMIRIEAIARGICEGQFPVRMPFFWMGGYGYASSVMYPDLFLYFPALLRLCGVSVVAAYKWYAFAINVLTVCISYFSFSKMFGSTKRGTLLTLIYCGSVYRFVNLYYREAVGEYTAMAFLPLLALGVFMLYSERENTGRNILKNTLILAFAISGILESHILSVEMVVMVGGLLAIVLVKKTFSKSVLLSGMLAAVITTLLNMGFLIPFLDYYKNVPMVINSTANNTEGINSLGMYLLELFSIPHSLGGSAVPELEERLATVPGPLLMMVLLGSLYIVLRGGVSTEAFRKKRLVLYLLFSTLCLWMASSMFPWDQLSAVHPAVGNILSSIQFPWRYMSLATLFLTLLTGEALYYFDDYSIKNIDGSFVYNSLMVLGLVSVLWCCGIYQKEAHTKFYENGPADLDIYNPMGGEYLPSGTTWEDVEEGLPQDYYFDNVLEYSDIYHRGATKQIHVVAGDEGGLVLFPAFSYKGYHVTDNYGSEYPIVNGALNRIGVHVPSNYDGTLTLTFVQPWYYRVADIVSLLTGLLVLLLLFIAVRPAFREEHLH